MLDTILLAHIICIPIILAVTVEICLFFFITVIMPNYCDKIKFL